MKRELTPIADWIDEGWGDIVSYKAIPMQDEWPFDKGTCVPYPTPWFAECRFKVVYENGAQANLVARGFEILSGRGFRGYDIKKGEVDEYPDYEISPNSDVRFFDKRLIALVAGHLARGEVVSIANKAEMPIAEKAWDILETYGIPLFPCEIDENFQADKCDEWLEKWKSEGIVVDEGDAFYVTRWLKEEEKLR